MLYNLTGILSSEEKVEKLTVPYEHETVSNGLDSYKILEKSDLTLTLANKAKGEAEAEGEISLVCEIPCDRSLKPVKVSFSLKISEYLKESDFEDPEKMEEMPFIEGFSLDTDALINNEIIVNWPMKVLCKPDCRGICKVCGKNLNEGDCGCDTFVPDPRMAVIKDIFNA